MNGNIFIIKNKVLISPPISSGCLDGVMRKKIIEFFNKSTLLDFEEKNISPFELISSDEIWLSNSISGIIPVSEYRKKSFSNELALTLINELNENILES